MSVAEVVVWSLFALLLLVIWLLEDWSSEDAP